IALDRKTILCRRHVIPSRAGAKAGHHRYQRQQEISSEDHPGDLHRTHISPDFIFQYWIDFHKDPPFIQDFSGSTRLKKTDSRLLCSRVKDVTSTPASTISRISRASSSLLPENKMEITFRSMDILVTSGWDLSRDTAFSIWLYTVISTGLELSIDS